jgi:2-polyprenyl-3-methyl-5-hydroxy-6-metoxy-1,4-benzoquinol methylase
VPQLQPQPSAERATARASYAFVEREECPSCGATNGETIYRSSFSDGAVGRFMRDYYKIDPATLDAAPYELVRCPDCTLVCQRFVGDDDLLGELYGEWINDSNRPECDPQYRGQVSAPLRSRDGHEILVAAEFLKTTPEAMTVLDFGMGWGLWARIARQLGCVSCGQELAGERVAYARLHGVKPVATEDLGEPRFDFINAEQVMEHVRDLAPTAARLAASLRPGGILKVSVPNAQGAIRIAADLNAGRRRATFDEIMPVQPLEHVNSFTARALTVLSRKLGLEIVRPGIVQSYAFLKRRGSVSLTDLRNTAKELVRPVYQYHNRRNLYVWMRKPA